MNSGLERAMGFKDRLKVVKGKVADIAYTVNVEADSKRHDIHHKFTTYFKNFSI